MRLLPNASFPIEFELTDLTDRMKDDGDLKKLWNPWLCPENCLIYLAWALSVDVYHDDWPIETRRRVIADSLDNHRMKGTTYAIQRSVDSLGYGVVIQYSNDDPEIEKGRFRVILSHEGVLADQQYSEIMNMINENKRGTLHLDRIRVSLRSTANAGVASHLKMGDSMIIGYTLDPAIYNYSMQVLNLSENYLKTVTGLN
jgi:phage tail P2-like protein